MSVVLTKAALSLKNPESNFEVVKFVSHKSKKKAVIESKKEIQDQTVSKKDIDLKKIRHEIVKFGMSGFNPNKKEEAKIALAVSLGAIPPKKQYLNYKELMAKRKHEKRKELAAKNSMKSKSLLQTTGKKKRGVQNDVGHFLSNYGKVQKKDLKKDQKGTQKEKGKKKNKKTIKQ